MAAHQALPSLGFSRQEYWSGLPFPSPIFRWHYAYSRKWRRASWWKWKKRVKPSLKLNIQKTKITASCPKTSWQIEGGKVEAVTDFIFLGSKITADDDCSHEIKRHLFLGRKAIINLYKKEKIDQESHWQIGPTKAGEDSWESLGQQEDQISQS